MRTLCYFPTLVILCNFISFLVYSHEVGTDNNNSVIRKLWSPGILMQKSLGGTTLYSEGNLCHLVVELKCELVIYCGFLRFWDSGTKFLHFPNSPRSCFLELDMRGNLLLVDHESYEVVWMTASMQDSPKDSCFAPNSFYLQLRLLPTRIEIVYHTSGKVIWTSSKFHGVVLPGVQYERQVYSP